MEEMRTENVLADLKRAFTSVHHVKPPASRAASPEIYLVARGFRGSGQPRSRMTVTGSGATG